MRLCSAFMRPGVARMRRRKARRHTGPAALCTPHSSVQAGGLDAPVLRIHQAERSPDAEEEAAALGRVAIGKICV